MHAFDLADALRSPHIYDRTFSVCEDSSLNTTKEFLCFFIESSEQVELIVRCDDCAFACVRFGRCTRLPRTRLFLGGISVFTRRRASVDILTLDANWLYGLLYS